MARMRTVKPEFFRSATIGKLKRDTRLLFIGMWTEADDHGRGLAEPRHLAGAIFPFDRDMTERKIRACLRELEQVVCADGKRGLVILYESSGTIYYAIRSWWHQKINRRGDARYPEPPPDNLFTDDSVNGGPPNHPPGSLNGTRQVSGHRAQGSGHRDLDPEGVANELESVSNDATSDRSPNPDTSHPDPKLKHAVELLVRHKGMTRDDAHVEAERLGAAGVFAMFSEAS